MADGTTLLLIYRSLVNGESCYHGANVHQC